MKLTSLRLKIKINNANNSKTYYYGETSPYDRQPDM